MVWFDFFVFKDVWFVCVVFGVFFMEWGLFVLLIYIVLYVVDYG